MLIISTLLVGLVLIAVVYEKLFVTRKWGENENGPF